MLANITTSSNFDSVQKIEITDRVLGGDLGTINIQARQLANRDHWLKDYIDSKVDELAGKMTPYYTVQIASASNYTNPSQFVAPIATYKHISMGEIFTNNATPYSANSVLYTMNIEVINDTTLDFKLFGVNTNIYIYLDGALKSSSTIYNNARTPKSLSFSVIPDTYSLQIVKNDTNGSVNNFLFLAAQVIGPDVLFVS